MKKTIIALGLALVVVGTPVLAAPQVIPTGQLLSIIASLQAQLNFLIAKLAQLQQGQSQGTSSNSSLTITSPIAGESLKIGSTKVISFSKPWPYVSNCFNRLQLIDDKSNVVGEMWVNQNQTSVSWSVGNISSHTCGTGNANLVVKPGLYKLRVKAMSADGMNEMNVAETGYFNVVDTVTPSQLPINITSPNGSNIWQLGSTQRITWDNNTTANMVLIELDLYAQDGYFIGPAMIQRYAKNIGYYDWQVGQTENGIISPTDRAKIKICTNIESEGSVPVCARSDYFFKITDANTPSLKASLNVTALNGAIQCFKAPCEFPLSGAQVTVYDANKLLVGSKIVGADGMANFVNLNPGTYTVYVSASGYTKTSGQTVGLVSGQSGSVKIPVFLNR